MSKVVVVLSGGMDSTVLLHHHLNVGDEVRAISFNYGQKHSKELGCAKEITSRLSVPWVLGYFPNIAEILPGSSQTEDDIAVPEGHYTEEVMKLTVVPNRNMILLALAAGHAIAHKFEYISYAAHAGDHAVYPDCRPEFYNALDKVLWLADWHRVELRAPFGHITKADIVREGARLGVDFSKTWSCLAEGTEVMSLAGPVPIEKLKEGQWVWGWKDGDWCPSQVQQVFSQGTKEVFEVVLDDRAGTHTKVVATADHRFLLRDGVNYVRVDEMEKGLSLMPAWLKAHSIQRGAYWLYHPKCDWSKIDYAHRRVADFFEIRGEVIHHKDENGLNNNPKNLEGKTRYGHAKGHGIREASLSVAANEKRSKTVKGLWKAMSGREWLARAEAISQGKQNNHKVVSVTRVGELPTWDIQTSTENFALRAGCFVHNCYKGQQHHCGRCGTCIERRESFHLAGIADPTMYLPLAPKLEDLVAKNFKI